MSLLQLACLVVAASAAQAAPAQVVLGGEDAIVNVFDPLHHLSAISPYFQAMHEQTPLPPTCKVKSAALLIRHSAIIANDDEWYEFMKPFEDKIANLSRKAFPKYGPWAFLENWSSPINEDNLEELSARGEHDAKILGKTVRKQYDDLFPVEESKKHKGSKDKKHKKKKEPSYKVWTASSGRDIGSAKAYILGSFPKSQSGPDGEGDGEQVELIEVPNKAKDWDKSLTPHKACDAFEKKSSLKPAGKWLSTYAPRVRARLSKLIPDVPLTDNDVLAMQMLCGYESIARGSSPFCGVFTDEEWLDVEYYFDIRFHYMMGYGNPISPYLGIPWVRTATHLLAGEEADRQTPSHPSSPPARPDSLLKGPKQKPLPSPDAPPNATHSQLLFPFFTHRESPAFVATALSLFTPTFSSSSPDLTKRDDERTWRTSELVPFLGNIALERLECADGDVVRAVVNGRMERMKGCDAWIGGTCGWTQFEDFVGERVEKWSGWEKVCAKKE